MLCKGIPCSSIWIERKRKWPVVVVVYPSNTACFLSCKCTAAPTCRSQIDHGREGLYHLQALRRVAVSAKETSTSFKSTKNFWQLSTTFFPTNPSVSFVASHCSRRACLLRLSLKTLISLRERECHGQLPALWLPPLLFR